MISKIDLSKPIVIVDFSEVFFISVFGWKRQGKLMPLEKFVLMKVLAYFKAYPDRQQVLVADGIKSWRKQVYPEYKGTRKKDRDKHTDLDWPDLFAKYAEMLQYFSEFTPAFVLREDQLEADDLIAVIAKHCPDTIAFSMDKDLAQLYVYPGFKAVLPRQKKIKNKYVIREVVNPLNELDKLVRLGDRSDNIPRATTDVQLTLNRKLVDLITLPEIIEHRCYQVIVQIHEKNYNPEIFCSRYPYKYIPEGLEKLWSNFPKQNQ